MTAGRMTAGVLSMWTVYDSPSDHPGLFVARRWEVSARGSTPTMDYMVSKSLDEVRGLLMHTYGLTRMERSVVDDPCIVETWM